MSTVKFSRDDLLGTRTASSFLHSIAAFLFAFLAWHGSDDSQLVAADDAVPSLDEVVAANRDVWGEMAMQQRNGASYEFFESLLPPPRYVHADFRYYPIVLS